MLMSRTYAPSPHLGPFLARHYVFSAHLPDDLTLIDRLLSETAFIRVLIRGEWSAELAPDQWQSATGALLFGANIRPLRVRVRGPFSVIGIAMRPCGWRALFSQPASDFSDRFVPLADVWGAEGHALGATVAPLADDSAIVAAAEELIMRRLDARGTRHTEPAMLRFEEISRMDSTRQVQDIATELGLSQRQLERLCKMCFGHSPKAILRRSRFLDMATMMRGMAERSEKDLAALRYFDQSHLAREFRRFIGLTPQQFEQTPTPLLSAGLKLRAERKRAEKKALLDR